MTPDVDPTGEGFDGPATLLLSGAGGHGAELAVTVHLRGRFEPIDGRYHWYGRIEASEALTEALRGRAAPGTLRTRHGEAAALLSDPDPWGRYRVDGVAAPPFPLRTGAGGPA